MFCRKCGNEIKEGENFCSKCGAGADSKEGLTKKQRSIITIVLCILVIGGLIGGIQLIVNNSNKNSEDHGKYLAESELNNNTINSYKNKIINKWNATLPLNNTNGLECAVYYKEGDELYLKYNMGICVIDKEDEVNRYMQGDNKYNVIYSLIMSAKNGSNNYMYITLEEFEEIIK